MAGKKKPNNKKPVARVEKKPVVKEEVVIDRTFPDVQPGRVVKVHQEISETGPKGEEKRRIQVFEGMVLFRKHGREITSTITVRKISGGIGVEKIFPLNSPNVKQIEVVKKLRVHRAKLGYTRTKHKRLKEIKDEVKGKK